MRRVALLRVALGAVVLGVAACGDDDGFLPGDGTVVAVAEPPGWDVRASIDRRSTGAFDPSPWAFGGSAVDLFGGGGHRRLVARMGRQPGVGDVVATTSIGSEILGGWSASDQFGSGEPILAWRDSGGELSVAWGAPAEALRELVDLVPGEGTEVGFVGRFSIAGSTSVQLDVDAGDRTGAVMAAQVGPDDATVLAAMLDANDPATARTAASFDGQESLVAGGSPDVDGHAARLGQLGRQNVLVVHGDPGLLLVTEPNGGTNDLTGDDLVRLATHARKATVEEVERAAR